MRTFVILFSLFWTIKCFAHDVWINMSDDSTAFEDAIADSDGLSMNQYQLDLFEKNKIESSTLLSKTDFWRTQNLNSQKIDSELGALQKAHVLSPSNRLVLFEYLRSQTPVMDGLTFKNLCHIYSNDSYLKTAEPFFESSCKLNRISLTELNPSLARFDFMVIDGNRINLKHSPYFYSVGSSHQFKFISNRYLTIEFTGNTTSLSKSKLTPTRWLDGTCNHVTASRVPESISARAYFSTDCQPIVQEGSHNSFWSRNKYYIISGILLAAVASSVSSQYELGLTLQN